MSPQSVFMEFDKITIAGFAALIIVAGVITSATDLCHRKICNHHLIFIAGAAAILVVTKGLLDKFFPALQLASTGCAIVIAVVFYKSNLWRGGDAKLFVCFSSLMLPTGFESKIYLPGIALFANAFILALIFVIFLIIRDLFINREFFKTNIFWDLKASRIDEVILTMFCLSWILFPIFYGLGLARFGVLAFLCIYWLTVAFSSQIAELVSNRVIAGIVLFCGVFLRYKFSPDFFLWGNILRYVIAVSVYCVLSYVLHYGTRYVVKSKDRVPFAPFLFLGCLLSYTPFLELVVSLQRILRV